MVHTIAEWMDQYVRIPGLPWWASIVVLVVLMASVSLAVTAFALVLIPSDYFAGRRPPDGARQQHPILRWTFRVVRNLVGWFLIGLGILLSLPGIPGQGLLTILLGVMLAEFPGKRRLEQKLIRIDRIRHAVDRLRAKFGRPPLEIHADEGRMKDE